MKGPAIRWQRWIAAVVAIALTAVAHSFMNTAARTGKGRLFVPEPEHARLSSLGFETVVADYYWIQALQLVGGERGDTRKHGPLIARLIDVVTTLDPWVGHPYRFAAVWLTGDETAVHAANRLLERGIAHDPLDWRNRYHLGFNHFFYLEENSRAADVLEGALPLAGAPNYLGALVARLRASQGSLEMAAGFLSELARNAQDEYARAEYLKALDEIETERRARYLDAAREEYWRRHGEDIDRVEDLRRGPDPIVSQLPAAHPQFGFARWVLDEKSGQIVSSYYRKRYELHSTQRDKQRREHWRELRAGKARKS